MVVVAIDELGGTSTLAGVLAAALGVGGLLGAMFVLIGILSDGVYALVAGSVRGWLAGSRRWWNAQRYASGCTFIGLGVLTAFAEPARD